MGLPCLIFQQHLLVWITLWYNTNHSKVMVWMFVLLCANLFILPNLPYFHARLAPRSPHLSMSYCLLFMSCISLFILHVKIMYMNPITRQTSSFKAGLPLNFLTLNPFPGHFPKLTMAILIQQQFKILYNYFKLAGSRLKP